MTEWPLNKCVPLLMVKRCVVALSALWVTCGPHTHTLTPDTKLMEVPGGPRDLGSSGCLGQYLQSI